MKITLTQTYDIIVPAIYEKVPTKDLINDLNRMYDINGKHIIETLNGEGDYINTILTHVDDEEITNDGALIILDGQPLDDLDDEEIVISEVHTL